MIIMLHGLPGTGKSFVAEELAKVLPSAIVLKTVSFRPVHGSGVELFDEENLQTRADKDVSYRVLCDEAGKTVKSGRIPILDATFHKKYRRQWVYDLAQELKVKCLVVSVVCDENVVFNRLKKRESKDGEDFFLNSKESYYVMKRQQDLLDEVCPVKIDTSNEVNIKEILPKLL